MFRWDEYSVGERLGPVGQSFLPLLCFSNFIVGGSCFGPVLFFVVGEPLPVSGLPSQCVTFF